MRKMILLLIALTMILVPTMAYAGEPSTHGMSNETENLINQKLENISNEVRKNKIEELINTPICYVVYIEGEETNDFVRPDYNYTELIDYLSELSDDEFEVEAKEIVNQVVNANKNNNNIIWTKEFKDAVVQEYCPQYESELQTELFC